MQITIQKAGEDNSKCDALVLRGVARRHGSHATLRSGRRGRRPSDGERELRSQFLPPARQLAHVLLGFGPAVILRVANHARNESPHLHQHDLRLRNVRIRALFRLQS